MIADRHLRRNARPRVLVIAEAANPEWVSVPLVGWSIANALRDIANVHLVTQVRNRDAILRTGLVEGRDFTAIDTEWLMRPLWRAISALGFGAGKGWTIVTAMQSLAYPHFERQIWKQLGNRVEDGEFDIVHRVTPLSPTASSLLASHCARVRVPFVMGPLNGGVPWPKGFNRERHKELEWLSYVRSLYKLMPGVRRTWREAAAIIVASRHTESELPAAVQSKVVYIPENAISPDDFSTSIDPSRYKKLNLCFIGRLVPYKGADIVLDAAAALLRAGRARLTIIGDGPMMTNLRCQADRLGVSASVTFLGWLRHHEVATAARQSSIFTFPSVREFGGGAVIEAMAMGLVPIVVNYGGPGEIVTDSTGVRIPIGSRQSIVEGMSAALDDMMTGSDHLAHLAENGLRRVCDLYTWEKKAAQVQQVYEWVLGRRDMRPDFTFMRPEASSSNSALT